ncbi:hypothetical protein HHK36_011200 [Tetracentron sinense]|uniref:TSL-kinase interacting protein 1 n=1 Tax=Tetracentron sinense TaxID=13715 RepID=A0A834ZBI3_TETSI|nr:hypothetical protein HHK36_011200 [Tetracentron sinense]
MLVWPRARNLQLFIGYQALNINWVSFSCDVFSMQTDLQVSLDCEAPLQSQNLFIKDGDSGLTSSTHIVVAPLQPVNVLESLANEKNKVAVLIVMLIFNAVKKQTRQWAAWTRQEEESFFNALRQNFEKITCRVQSKNKDQVRHYYYRLVRRMNKLLGPGFILDAKNSKDTNAAMLRWWSLLEKYSCKASKLHLKPRRFKIFIEALEHQLLKDRKKTIKRRPSQVENCPSVSPTTVSHHSKASGHDTRSVKLVIVDSHNIQRVGSGKGPSSKRNINIGVTRSNNKCDSSAVKTARQRRKPGPVSSAAFKRWEKAAMAGVSLVADAAEHLERTTTDQKVNPDQGTLDESFPRLVVTTNGQMGIGKILPPLPSFSQPVKEISAQPSTKLKLQLFPIDESTRRALEKDEHNPHLELTLSARKKMSSVLEHLNRKWGNASIASGEMMLFPYSAQRESLAGYQRWMQDTIASAADVYAIIGSPPLFRLRYGWFSNTELASVTFRAPSTSLHIQEEHTSMNISNGREQIVDATPTPAPPTSHHSDQLMKSSKDRLTSLTENTGLIPSYSDLSDDVIGYVSMCPKNNIPEPSEHAANSSWLGKETGDGTIRRQWEDVVFILPYAYKLCNLDADTSNMISWFRTRDNLRSSNGTTLSAGEWADSLTNISIGDLLSEASHGMDTSCIDPPAMGSSQCLQQITFSCDSFDAAIAAHISRHQDNAALQSVQVSHVSSIWDAEETCDAFSFRKIPVMDREAPSPSGIATLGACKQIASISFRGLAEELPEIGPRDDHACEGDLMNNCQSNTHSPNDSARDLSELSDIYWSDSLGPFDLEIPSSRFRGEDLMLGESNSLSGLNRLIASSLDAFQNCSFFGLDKKEPSSTVEAQGTDQLPNYKIDGEV